MRAARLHLHDTKVLQIITIPKDRKKRHESINSKLFLYSCIVRWMISIYFCHESSHTSWLRWELHRDKDLCIATTFTELMFPLQIKLLWSNTFCFNLLLLFFASIWVTFIKLCFKYCDQPLLLLYEPDLARIVFLSDPGKPGVRSLGPDVRH